MFRIIWTLLCIMFLKIATINVRGLLDQGKFEKLKVLCKRSNVLVVQETNWRGEVMESFKRKWKGDIFYNNGDGRKGRGVAFLIKRECVKKHKWFMMIWKGSV